VIERHPSARWRDTPSSLLILGPDDDVVRLVGPGRQLWLALDAPTTLEAMTVEAGGDAEAVAEFVTELRALGLVVDVPA